VSIYKRLFDSLSPSHPTPFDWKRFFDSEGLDPTLPFTDQFQAQINPTIISRALESSAGKAENIQQLKGLLDSLMSDIGGSQDDLKLVYIRRTREDQESAQTNHKNKRKGNEVIDWRVFK